MTATDTQDPMRIRARYFSAKFDDSEALQAPEFPALPAGFKAEKNRLPGVYKVTKGACSQYIHWDRGAWRDGDSNVWEVPGETI